MYNEVNFAFFLDKKRRKKSTSNYLGNMYVCAAFHRNCFGKLDFLSNYLDKTFIPQKTSMQPLTWKNRGKIDIMKIPAKNKL